jgi:stage II sporulation protein D
VSRLVVRLFAAAALIASVLGVVTAFAPPAGAAPSSFHFEGGGFGHGVGMSQYGALGYAQQGWNYPDILKHYFTGTDITSVTPKAETRIQIGDDNTAPADLTITPSGHVNIVLQGNTVAGAEKDQQIVVTVTNGKFNVSVAGNPVLDQVGGGSDNLYIQYNGSPVAVADTGHSYKYGQLELSAPAATQLKTTIASMGMNEYLRGLGEVPSSWAANALKAQVLAARSYAQYKFDHGSTFLYGDVRDQNYVGYDKETGSGGANWVAAVNDTGNEMVTYQGSVAQTFYSSSSGGYTENSENVFSATVPYLKGVPDPYDAANGQNSLHSWKRDWTLAQMQSFVNSNSSSAVGTLQSLEFLLPLGVSGRVAKVIDATHGGVRITGSDGTKRVNGTAFQSIINAAPGSGSNALPSTLMSLGGASPYGSGFTGGVFVAAGHLSGGDVDRVVTGADKGGGPHVRVLDTNGDPTGVEFMAYDSKFSGGVRVAVCHFGEDGTDSVVTAPGAGGGPHVRVFNADGSAHSGGFMAYSPTFTGGVYVGGGNISGDGAEEVVTGAGDPGGPHVRVFGQQGNEITGFMAFQTSSDHGARVAAAHTPGGAVVAGSGPGGPSLLRVITL